MADMTKEQALEVAIDYLRTQYQPHILDVAEELPEGTYYGVDADYLKNCWFVTYGTYPEELHMTNEPEYILCISRETGEVVRELYLGTRAGA